MRSLLIATISFLLSAPLQAEDGFRPLFNGKDLGGWINVNCAPETWSVKDGMIHCTGKPIGALRTDRQYENFILELEWRHLKPGGNAGVFIWASPVSAKGQPFLRAIEVQVLDHAYGKSDWFTTHGDVFPIHGSKMKPHGRHNGMRSFPSEERSKGSPEWNNYRIECNEGVLRLHVNGKEVSGGSDCNWRKGYIALESEGSPIDFKNIRIKELPPTGATAEQSAPEARGFETVYTGTDLRGWKTDDKGWRSSDWRLTYKPTGDAEKNRPIWCEKTFGNGEISFDWKRPKGAKGSVEVLLEGVDQPIFRSDKANGGWQRTQIKFSDETYKLLVDGKELSSGTLPDGKSSHRFGLHVSEGAAEFAGIYLLSKETN